MKPEFVWREWRLGEGAFKECGPANPKCRPASLPKLIPPLWWARLALFLQKRKKPGFFARNGVFLRNPRGGVEDVHTMRLAGVEWVAINLGDHALSEWDVVRQRCEAEGLDCIPWQRTRNVEDVVELAAFCTWMDAKAMIVNLETEAKDTLPPSLVASTLSGFLKQWALSTNGWMYNGVDWTPIASHPALLQWFYEEVPSLKGKLADCVEHAHELGMKTVYPTFQAYATEGVRPLPAACLAAWAGPFSLFTGDDVQEWMKWRR